jgi:hypothetical protein
MPLMMKFETITLLNYTYTKVLFTNQITYSHVVVRRNYKETKEKCWNKTGTLFYFEIPDTELWRCERQKLPGIGISIWVNMSN